VSLADLVRAATGRDVRSAARVGGGDINEGWRVELDDGTPAFAKTRPDVASGEYAAEAAGLRWLAEPGALRLPAVLGVSDAVLVLEWVPEGGRGDPAALGAGLAEIHAAGAPAFGATPPAAVSGGPAAGSPAPASPGAASPAPPTRIGPLLLPNDPTPDWAAFYAERRVLPVLAHAGLDAAGVRAVERVCDRMAELAGPAEPPARLHGDLWSGNVLWDRAGEPWLIDPGAYGGHREVDLAMLDLFGAPGPAFLNAYAERYPLAAGHAERVALWQLFPLLVHAALFGGGYRQAAANVAARYA
jgi:fructosamine-3-kinase